MGTADVRSFRVAVSGPREVHWTDDIDGEVRA